MRMAKRNILRLGTDLRPLQGIVPGDALTKALIHHRSEHIRCHDLSDAPERRCYLEPVSGKTGTVA